MSDDNRTELIENNRRAVRNFWRERFTRDRLITACKSLDEYIACRGEKLKPVIQTGYFWNGFDWMHEIDWGDW